MPEIVAECTGTALPPAMAVASTSARKKMAARIILAAGSLIVAQCAQPGATFARSAEPFVGRDPGNFPSRLRICSCDRRRGARQVRSDRESGIIWYGPLFQLVTAAQPWLLREWNLD